MSDDLIGRFRKIGLRVPADSLGALLTHATKSRLSPVEFAEQLVVLEVHEREGRNLALRTKDATLGTIPPLDRFDWNHPRAIDRGIS